MSNETLLVCFLGIHFLNMFYIVNAFVRLHLSIIDISEKLDNFL